MVRMCHHLSCILVASFGINLTAVNADRSQQRKSPWVKYLS
jgi:hypothetical protein